MGTHWLFVEDLIKKPPGAMKTFGFGSSSSSLCEDAEDTVESPGTPLAFEDKVEDAGGMESAVIFWIPRRIAH